MKTDGYQQKMPDKHGEFVPWILEGCDILTVKNFMHSADVCLQKHILGGMTPSNSGPWQTKFYREVYRKSLT